MFVRHLAQPESLGIIVWLLHCCSLAGCAKDMAAARHHSNCCHEHPNCMPKNKHGVRVLLCMCMKSTVVEEPSTSVEVCFVMQQLQLLEEHLVSSQRELTVTEALWLMPQSDAGLNIHK